MKTTAITGLLLTAIFTLMASYVQQSLIFSTTDEINVTGYQQNYVVTDCIWFNDLAIEYSINRITFLCDYEIDVYNWKRVLLFN